MVSAGLFQHLNSVRYEISAFLLAILSYLPYGYRDCGSYLHSRQEKVEGFGKGCCLNQEVRNIFGNIITQSKCMELCHVATNHGKIKLEFYIDQLDIFFGDLVTELEFGMICVCFGL